MVQKSTQTPWNSENIFHCRSQQELNFNYDGISMEEAIDHIGLFISGVWQIHPFAEGNTRTTAVLLIKYLRFIGFEVDNSPFARYSWYFRNALVHASYRNSHKRINKDTTFLRRFLSNLLIGTHYELKNRFMLIPEAPTEQVTEQVPGLREGTENDKKGIFVTENLKKEVQTW